MVGRGGHIQPCYKEIRWGLLPYDLYLGRYLSLLYKAPVCILVKERKLLYHSGVKKKKYKKEKVLDDTFVIRLSLGLYCYLYFYLCFYLCFSQFVRCMHV